ncbi:MAG TPA: fructose-6-phosphate aldolase, partial [Rhodospirillales bacterium]|nr:fructose-6-phosphate aldolase [Rhodospirillales bacterium]
MKFFLDTADVAEIADLASAGMVDGVTTNPSLVAKTGRDLFELLAEIAGLVPGPISAEVTATDQDGMLREAHRLAEIASNICIKLPLTWDGLRACRR